MTAILRADTTLNHKVFVVVGAYAKNGTAILHVEGSALIIRCWNTTGSAGWAVGCDL